MNHFRLQLWTMLPILLVVCACASNVSDRLSSPFAEGDNNIEGAYYTELIDIDDKEVTHMFDTPTKLESLPSDWKELGADIYRLNCAGCHGARGAGADGAYPALANSTFVNGAYGPVVTLPMYGKGAMPSFSGLLSDAEIAMVISYIRNAWGNDAPAVSPSQVAPFRNADYEVPLAAFEAFFGMTQGNNYETVPE